MKHYEFDAVVIGSGCAGYNAADTLYSLGMKNIAILTEKREYGTSRNTGSDKQTYYKLSLAGDESDSVMQMAQTLFNGGGMDGDIALVEAANSVRCFMKLKNLGVDFPTNEYGEFVGYKTDHDPYSRASSIGPYTSKRMTEVLEEEVMRKGIEIIDSCAVIELLTDEKRITGLIALDASSKESVDFIAVKTPYVILATGGPASVYYNSVYPKCHTGSSSLALSAGAEFANLSEWQYGIASTEFRWNLSGSYQQVIPKYVSIDENGTEREFLFEYFKSKKEVFENVFLKGYEWPFQAKKINSSSLVDIAVYNESVLLGRKVFIDFRSNPTGLELTHDGIGKTAYDYLKNSSALSDTPIKRLEKMNPEAIKLYTDNGIDLYSSRLRIEVCAQHSNGGVRINSDYESTVKGLYAIGEAAGAHGISRPGGSALNSCQVGGLRAANHIVYEAANGISKNYDAILASKICSISQFISAAHSEKSTLSAMRERYQKRMSRTFAQKRCIDEMKNALAEAVRDLGTFEKDNKWNRTEEIFHLFKNLDLLKMQTIIGKSMIFSAERFGSRGSALIVTSEGKAIDCASDAKDFVVISREDEITAEPVRKIPKRELWFEGVWASHKAKSENKR